VHFLSKKCVALHYDSGFQPQNRPEFELHMTWATMLISWYSTAFHCGVFGRWRTNRVQ